MRVLIILPNLKDSLFTGLSDGAILKVVEEPYTVREARIHVRHVRDLLKSVDSSDAYGGQDGASLAFLNTVCSNDIERKSKGSGK